MGLFLHAFKHKILDSTDRANTPSGAGVEKRKSNKNKNFAKLNSTIRVR